MSQYIVKAILSLFRKRKDMKQANRIKRLEARRADFDAGSKGDKRDRQGDRWAEGGFHRPGSMSK